MTLWVSFCSVGCHLCPEELLLCVSAEHRALKRPDWGQEPVTSVWNSTCCLLPAGLHSQMGQGSTDMAAVGGKKRSSHLLGEVYLLVQGNTSTENQILFTQSHLQLYCFKSPRLCFLPIL